MLLDLTQTTKNLNLIIGIIPPINSSMADYEEHKISLNLINY